MKIRTFSFLLLICLISISCFPAIMPSFAADNLRLNSEYLTMSVSDVHLCSQDQSIYALWQGENTNIRSVFFQHSPDGGTTWLNEEKIIQQIPLNHKIEQLHISSDLSSVYASWIQHDMSSNTKTILVAISPDHGASWQIHAPASVPASQFAGTDFAHNQTELCVVWASTEIFARCSSDNGQNWTPAKIVNTTGFPINPKDTQTEPTITSGGNGRFYVAWTDNRGASGVERYIFVTRTENAGQTWEPDQKVIDFPSNGPLCITPDIAADTNGHAIVTWINKIWWGQGETYRYTISSAYSSDAGITWEQNNAATGYGIAPQLLFDKISGRFFLFWLNDSNHAYRKILMRSSVDFGANWNETIEISPHHDVQEGNYQAAVSGETVATTWENLKPWPGIYVNYSSNNGASWLKNESRIDHAADDTTTTLPSLTISSDGDILVAWEDLRDGRANLYMNHSRVSRKEQIRAEADYILSCQYLGNDTARGAINNVQGDPTWIVPRENAMAILGLLKTADYLQESLYRDRAQLAADYLIRIQNADGSWMDQYEYDHSVNSAKSPTQTAEVMMALYHLGYRSDRYSAMKSGAQFLLSLQDPVNKQGQNDGLICGGKDSFGNYLTWRWTSDNAYAYHALQAAYAWALIKDDGVFAQTCLSAANRILQGINSILRNPPVWHTAVDEWGNPQGNPDLPTELSHLPNWISYAPQMLDMPVSGANDISVGDWIASSFQQDNGSLIAYSWDGDLKTRQYPGYSFQAALAWFDTGAKDLASRAIEWTDQSGLWDTTSGGWVDWNEISPEPGLTAPSWQRFIDTSFYSIAARLGGFDFNSHYHLNLNTPYYAASAPISSGSSTARMILNFIREGAGASSVNDRDIAQYLRSTDNLASVLTPTEMDKVLGHFDPYDQSISDQRDSYDSLPDGNPYQGYNFTINSYSPDSDQQAMEKYLRDICHWMDYPVTQHAWFQTPRKLVARPHTPSAVPLFGSYDHWVVVKGFRASSNPNPDPYTNPYATPMIKIYGLWISDPNLNDGIGANTYKTASECASTFLKPVQSTDSYARKLINISEPPSKQKASKLTIHKPSANADNLRAILSQDTTRVRSSKSRSSKNPEEFPIKKPWRELADPALLQNPDVIKAFEGKQQKSALLVKRLDNRNEDYYLVPYGSQDASGRIIATGVLILNANQGYFKEASWTNTPAILLPVSEKDAHTAISKYLCDQHRTTRNQFIRKGWFGLYTRLIQQYLLTFFSQKARAFADTDPDLVWRASLDSPTPYKPIWRFATSYETLYVTQDGEVKNKY